MCEFVSWNEQPDGSIYFLTSKDVNKAKREHPELTTADVQGHTWLRKIKGISGGIDRECTDFSSPANFPAEIANAIKRGEMDYGIFPDALLTKKVLAAATRSPQYKEADAKWQEADAKLQEAYAKWQEADAELQEAHAKWQEADAKWREAYAKLQKAVAKWREALAKLQEAYAKLQEADAELQEAHAKCKWQLFRDPKNRARAWR